MLLKRKLFILFRLDTFVINLTASDVIALRTQTCHYNRHTRRFMRQPIGWQFYVVYTLLILSEYNSARKSRQTFECPNNLCCQENKHDISKKVFESFRNERVFRAYNLDSKSLDPQRACEI